MKIQLEEGSAEKTTNPIKLWTNWKNICTAIKQSKLKMEYENNNFYYFIKQEDIVKVWNEKISVNENNQKQETTIGKLIGVQSVDMALVDK